MTIFALIVVFPICMACAVFSDVMTMTISNKIPIALIASFFIFCLVMGTPPATVGAHAGIGFVALAITFGCFAAGWMGGGDAKLIAATALWFGPGTELLDYLLMSSLYGGVLTLLLLVLRSVMVPATGIGFLDRLLRRGGGVPYGVALGAAGITIFASGAWYETALRGLT